MSYCLGYKARQNFRRKARLVTGGHTMDTPSTKSYFSVISHVLVPIALTLTALNHLKILACNIQNANLIANYRERIYTVAGSEFDSEAGHLIIIDS